MPYYDIEPTSFNLKTMWSWLLGGTIGTVYYIKTFSMPYILEIDWTLLLQYGKLIFFAVSGGFATNVGKWIVDVIRKRRENKSEPPKIP